MALTKNHKSLCAITGAFIIYGSTGINTSFIQV